MRALSLPEPPCLRAFQDTLRDRDMDEPRHGVGVEDHHPHRRRGRNIAGTPNLEAAKTLMD